MTLQLPKLLVSAFDGRDAGFWNQYRWRCGRPTLSQQADQDHLAVQRRFAARYIRPASIAQQLSGSLAQSVVVENRPGGGTTPSAQRPAQWPFPMATPWCR